MSINEISAQAQQHMSEAGSRVLWTETGTIPQLMHILQKNRVLYRLGSKVSYPIPYYPLHIGYQIVDGNTAILILPTKEYDYTMFVYDIWRIK